MAMTIDTPVGFHARCEGSSDALPRRHYSDKSSKGEAAVIVSEVGRDMRRRERERAS